MKILRLGFVVGLLLSGCVGMDTWGVRSHGDLPVEGLTREQMQQLKSAAASGEPALVATAARMAWEDPGHAASLANYAANLAPDRTKEIAEAVANALGR